MRPSRTRIAVVTALILYSAAIIVFALFPLNDIDWAEVITIGLACASIVGLVAHLLPGVTLPHEDYAYLFTGWCGFTVLLLYLVDVNSPPDHEQWRNTLLLLSGVVGGYGAYWGERT